MGDQLTLTATNTHANEASAEQAGETPTPASLAAADVPFVMLCVQRFKDVYGSKSCPILATHKKPFGLTDASMLTLIADSSDQPATHLFGMGGTHENTVKHLMWGVIHSFYKPILVSDASEYSHPVLLPASPEECAGQTTENASTDSLTHTAQNNSHTQNLPSSLPAPISSNKDALQFPLHSLQASPPQSNFMPSFKQEFDSLDVPLIDTQQPISTSSSAPQAQYAQPYTHPLHANQRYYSLTLNSAVAEPFVDHSIPSLVPQRVGVAVAPHENGMEAWNTEDVHPITPFTAICTQLLSYAEERKRLLHMLGRLVHPHFSHTHSQTSNNTSTNDEHSLSSANTEESASAESINALFPSDYSLHDFAQRKYLRLPSATENSLDVLLGHSTTGYDTPPNRLSTLQHSDTQKQENDTNTNKTSEDHSLTTNTPPTAQSLSHETASSSEYLFPNAAVPYSFAQLCAFFELRRTTAAVPYSLALSFYDSVPRLRFLSLQAFLLQVPPLAALHTQWLHMRFRIDEFAGRAVWSNRHALRGNTARTSKKEVLASEFTELVSATQQLIEQSIRQSSSLQQNSLTPNTSSSSSDVLEENALSKCRPPHSALFDLPSLPLISRLYTQTAYMLMNDISLFDPLVSLIYYIECKLGCRDAFDVLSLFPTHRTGLKDYIRIPPTTTVTHENTKESILPRLRTNKGFFLTSRAKQTENKEPKNTANPESAHVETNAPSAETNELTFGPYVTQLRNVNRITGLDSPESEILETQQQRLLRQLILKKNLQIAVKERELNTFSSFSTTSLPYSLSFFDVPTFNNTGVMSQKFIKHHTTSLLTQTLLSSTPSADNTDSLQHILTQEPPSSFSVPSPERLSDLFTTDAEKQLTWLYGKQQQKPVSANLHFTKLHNALPRTVLQRLEITYLRNHTRSIHGRNQCIDNYPPLQQVVTNNHTLSRHVYATLSVQNTSLVEQPAKYLLSNHSLSSTNLSSDSSSLTLPDNQIPNTDSHSNTSLDTLTPDTNLSTSNTNIIEQGTQETSTQSKSQQNSESTEDSSNPNLSHQKTDNTDTNQESDIPKENSANQEQDSSQSDTASSIVPSTPQKQTSLEISRPLSLGHILSEFMPIDRIISIYQHKLYNIITLNESIFLMALYRILRSSVRVPILSTVDQKDLFFDPSENVCSSEYIPLITPDNVSSEKNEKSALQTKLTKEMTFLLPQSARQQNTLSTLSEASDTQAFKLKYLNIPYQLVADSTLYGTSTLVSDLRVLLMYLETEFIYESPSHTLRRNEFSLNKPLNPPHPSIVRTYKPWIFGLEDPSSNDSSTVRSSASVPSQSSTVQHQMYRQGPMSSHSEIKSDTSFGNTSSSVVPNSPNRTVSLSEFTRICNNSADKFIRSASIGLTNKPPLRVWNVRQFDDYFRCQFQQQRETRQNQHPAPRPPSSSQQSFPSLSELAAKNLDAIKNNSTNSTITRSSSQQNSSSSSDATSKTYAAELQEYQFLQKARDTATHHTLHIQGADLPDTADGYLGVDEDVLDGEDGYDFNLMRRSVLDPWHPTFQAHQNSVPLSSPSYSQKQFPPPLTQTLNVYKNDSCELLSYNDPFMTNTYDQDYFESFEEG